MNKITVLSLSCAALSAFVTTRSDAAMVAVSAVTVTGGEVSVNLSDEGQLDWVNLGGTATGPTSTARSEKAGVSLISTVAFQNATPAAFFGDHTMTWSGGEGSLASAIDKDSSWEAKADAAPGSFASLNFDVTGLDTGDYRLKVYNSIYEVGGTLTASIGGATDSSSITSPGFQLGIYTIDFSIDSGETLSVDWAVSDHRAFGSERNVGMSAITLNTVPEPSAGMFLFLGAMTLASLRKRRGSPSTKP